MKFTVPRAALQDALTDALAGGAAKSTLPILSHVLITAAPDRITVNATDLDVAVSVSLPGDVETSGEVTLPAKRLLEIAKQAAGETVRVAAASDGRVAVESGKARYKLLAMPVAEFPTFPKVDFGGNGTVSAAALDQMIGQVAYAASSSESRPTLQGVLWELRPDRMGMVATDGHRLAKIHVPATCGETADLIVPTRALELVRRLFAGDEPVEVARTASHIGFWNGSRLVLSRLIEGPFPNYSQVLPKDHNRAIALERDAFLAAVRRVAILADEGLYRLRLSGTASGITVSAQTADLGTASENVSGTWDGDTLEIGVNAAYLIETLRRVPTPEMRMTFKGPEYVIGIEPVGWNDPATWLALVMPLRLVD